MDFEQQVRNYLRKAEKQYQPPFEVQHDVTRCGQTFPMLASFTRRDERYFMRIQGALAQEGLCGEQCFFDSCERLDDAAWERYTALLSRLHDTLVPKEDAAHDFTLISFVLCTRGVDRAMQKKIRRYRDHREYKKDGYGWSAVRLCVVDLDTETYYCNGMGKSVVECLTREEFPTEKKHGLFR